jgi:hypothetical protein
MGWLVCAGEEERPSRTDAHTPVTVAPDWGPPVRLGPPINTPQPEDAIEISPDGRRLYFMRTTDVLEKLTPQQLLSRPNGTYVAQRIGGPGEFGPPRFYNLEKGVALSLSGETSHTADGKTVYFHSIRPTNLGYQQRPPKDDILDIYVAEVRDGEPGPGVNVGPPVNSVYPDGEHFITPDGKTLYFTSSRPGGLGGYDIYVSHQTEQGWSEPENLGPPINTPRNEGQPAFAFGDLDTMYWTSNRDPTIGTAIYRSHRGPDGRWSEPELVLKGIVGEPTLTADGRLLYFVHVLTDAQGVFDADIWYVERRPDGGDLSRSEGERTSTPEDR